MFLCKMSRRVDRYVKRVQDDIVSCSDDQTPVDGIVLWLNDKPIELESLLVEHKVPESLWEDVVSHLQCPKCGAPLNARQEVGTKPDHEKQLEAARQRYDEKLYELSKFLRTTPYLGALHPMGKKIAKEIKKFPKSVLSDEFWFRARRVDSPSPMTTDDLRPPDPDKHEIPEGRFHHYGQACWYLANDRTAAASEVTSSTERLAWVQQWKTELISNLLDLRAWQSDDDRVLDDEGEPMEFPSLAVALIFGDRLTAKPKKDCSWRPEYFVPRFVADTARRAGFSGILFTSTRSYGENLVLFDRNAALVPVGTPELIHLAKRKLNVGMDCFCIKASRSVSLKFLI